MTSKIPSCIAIGLLIGLVGGCATPQTNGQRDLGVLTAAVEQLCLENADFGGSTYELLSDKALQPSLSELTGRPENLSARIFDSLLSRNYPAQLPALELCPSIKSISETAIDAALAKGIANGRVAPWEGLIREYPGAREIVRISMPGYSRTGAEALILVERECGMLCASGVYLVFRRVGNSWQFVQLIPAWVS